MPLPGHAATGGKTAAHDDRQLSCVFLVHMLSECDIQRRLTEGETVRLN